MTQNHGITIHKFSSIKCFIKSKYAPEVEKLEEVGCSLKSVLIRKDKI